MQQIYRDHPCRSLIAKFPNAFLNLFSKLWRRRRYPNGYNTSNRRWFDIDITSILQKENIDDFLCHFDVFVWCSFNGQKTHVVLTYFVWRNVDERKINAVSMYFFQRNFDELKLNVISMYLFQSNFNWRCAFGRQELEIALISFFDKFLINKIENRLDVSFRCNFVLMYFFNVIFVITRNVLGEVFKDIYTTTAWKMSVFGVILVRNFPHSDWMRKDTKYLSEFSPNAGKYWPE